MKVARDDVDAALALVKLDLEARDPAKAMPRLEALLGRLLRGKEDERVISLLWQVWPMLSPADLKPGFAFNLARAADAVDSGGEGLVGLLYARAGDAPGVMGAKALLRAAELALRTSEPHEAAKYVDALLAKADAGSELQAKGRALKGLVPAPPVAPAAMDSGLELDRRPGVAEQTAQAAADPISSGLELNRTRPAPKVVACVLLAVTPEGLSLQSSTGDHNALPFAKVLAVAAGLVPLAAPGAAVRGLLLVDLIMAWGDERTAPVAVRLDSDTTAMSKLFPGATVALVYGAFFARLLEASGATAITPGEDLKTGKFPRYPSVAARDLAVFATP